MDFDVIIAGAGAVGLAAAAALARSADDSLRIALVDRTPFDDLIGEREDARAWAISASSCRMLQVIGAWELLAEHAQPVATIEITDTPLEAAVRLPILHFDNTLEEPGNDRSQSPAHSVPASWIIENSRLVAALQSVVRGCPNVTCLIPAEIASFRASSEAADLVLSDGRELRARLVIAVDGRKSKLRRQAGIKTVGWNYDQHGIVTTVCHDKPHHGLAVQHFLPSGPFAILPLKGNRSSLVWTEKAAIAASMMRLGDADFLAEVERRFGGRLGELRLAGPRASWPLEMHLARSFTAGRLALAGDAAHGVHPIAGQGLNIGLRDVAALAEVIVETHRLGLDFGDAETLGRYARWRRFDATMSAFAFDGINRIFSNDNPFLRTLRDFGASTIDRVPALKKMLIEEASGVRGELPRLLRGETV